MPLSTWGGILFMLMGLGSAWVGVYVPRVNRSPARRADAPPRRPMSRAETWLWLIGWTMVGLGWICLGLTTLRHARGRYVMVPASAPLIDQVIWVFFFVGVFGGFAVLYAGAWVRYAQEGRSRREDSSSP